MINTLAQTRIPKTITDLKHKLEGARWFSALGVYQGDAASVALPSLEAWRSDEPHANARLERIAQEMTWLPSDAGEPDPFASTNNKALSREDRRRTLDVYKTSLRSLRNAPHAKLFDVGPHDFSEAAKAAAAYAARHAAIELLRDEAPGIGGRANDAPTTNGQVTAKRMTLAG